MDEVYFRFREGSSNVNGVAIKGRIKNGDVTDLEHIQGLTGRDITFRHVSGNRYQVTFPQGTWSSPPMYFFEDGKLTYDLDFSPQQPRVLSSSDGTPGFLELITRETAEKMVEDATNFALMRAWII